jgi:hypothetical protein
MIPVTLSRDTGYSGLLYLVRPCTPVSSDPGIIKPPERHVAGPDFDRHRE